MKEVKRNDDQGLSDHDSDAFADQDALKARPRAGLDELTTSSPAQACVVAFCVGLPHAPRQGLGLARSPDFLDPMAGPPERRLDPNPA